MDESRYKIPVRRQVPRLVFCSPGYEPGSEIRGEFWVVMVLEGELVVETGQGRHLGVSSVSLGKSLCFVSAGGRWDS